MFVEDKLILVLQYVAYNVSQKDPRPRDFLALLYQTTLLSIILIIKRICI